MGNVIENRQPNGQVIYENLPPSPAPAIPSTVAYVDGQITTVNASLTSGLATKLSLAGGSMTGQEVFKRGADIASAATVNLATATGNVIKITGNTGPVTAITIKQGQIVYVDIESTPTLTNNAAIILPSGANIVCAAGDTFTVVGLLDNVAAVFGYQRADGTALVGGSGGITSKVGTFTRDMSAATGNVAYTGVGFKPSLIIFTSQVDGANASLALAFTPGSSNTYGVSIIQNAGGAVNYKVDALAIQPVNGQLQQAYILSMDNDGFTLSWTKYNSPSGTATVRYIAFK